MSTFTAVISKTWAIIMALFQAKINQGTVIAPSVAATVVTDVGSHSLTFGQVSAFLQVVEGIDVAKIKSVLGSKTDGAATDGAIMIAEDVAAILGALDIIPGGNFAKDAIEGFVWLVEHNGQGPEGYVYPPQVYSGRSQRPPTTISE